MKLALNYSPEAERLVDEGKVQIDCFKCPGWPDLVARAQQSKPVYVHFALDAGVRNLGSTDWLALEELRARTDTPYVNIHLSTTIDAFPGFPVDTREASHRDAVAASFIADVSVGVRPQEYISALPIQSLRELHITGIQHDGVRWRDSMPMTADDWAVAEWVLAHIRSGAWPEPWAVAFEYGGVGRRFEWRTDARVLAAQVPRLHALVHGQAER